MGDGGAEGALCAGALRIGVDPVVIAREFREGVDQFLRDLDLAAPGAEGLADKFLQGVDIVEAILLHGVLRSGSGKGFPGDDSRGGALAPP